MKRVRNLQVALAMLILVLTASRGLSEDASTPAGLIQVSFDRLVARSYPVVHPRFDRLRSTTYPVIHPGVPRVHIAENLVNSRAQPLLLPYQVR